MKQGTIKFDRNVKVLGESAFEGLSTLTSITIPKSVQIIENNAFKGCSNIEKIIYKGTADNWYNISIEEFYDTSIIGKTVSCIDNDIIIPNYLTFTALEDGEIGFYVNPDASIQPTIEYSYDKQNWNTLTEEYVSVPSGSNLYCRGINPFGISPGFDEGNHNHFISTGQFNISGDIMSLIDYKHSVKEMIGTMRCMFGYEDGTNYVDIVDASNLILSAETLTSDCYQNMFDSCVNMVYPPQIKATTLAPYCCYKMFYNCSSLEYAPELPATILDLECYNYMFNGCTSLVTAPSVLPATELADGCYSMMFYNCESLTTAPELPATTLAYGCYSSMFSHCTSLVTAPELSATELAEQCYSYMFYGCSSLTTAPELPATTLADDCYSEMFSGCTSLTTAPELPATTLTESCYFGMFNGCTSLLAAPELPAATLAVGCYSNMFNNCTNLNCIKCLATDISAYFCTINWVKGVASTGTFIKHPDMTDWTTGVNGIPRGWVVENVEIPYITFTAQQNNSSIGLEKLSTYQTLEYSTDTTTWNTFDTTTNISLNNGDEVYVRGVLSADNTDSNYTRFKMSGKIAASGNCNAIWNYQDLNAPLKAYCGKHMFYGCTSLTTAPELPATTLADWCYENMFTGCSSLTISPELPAITLTKSCYNSMFSSCTSLVTAPELPATTLANWCYQYMFSHCSSLVTSPELPATTLTKGCYGYMFFNCTGLTAAPELPITTLADWCYEHMFFNCTGLTAAPELPATTLTEYCYYGIFGNCSNLTEIKCLATDISASNCTAGWVEGVAETGTFIKNPDMNDWEIDSVNGIPTGWTIKNVEIPYVTFKAEEDNSSIGLAKLSTNQTLEYSRDGSNWSNMNTYTNISLNNGDKVYVRGILSADNTSSNSKYTQFKMSGKIAASGNCNALWNYQDLNAPLKEYCGRSMFSGCTSLTTAPVLPATELAKNCYYYMFNKCTSLTTAPELPATELAESCYTSMFYGCSSLTTAPVLSATTLATYCYSGMFTECTSLTTAPELPVTELATYCYSGMFTECTSLTTAPVLSATTLADNCYSNMFKNCTSLTTAPELPATTLATYCYSHMFENCTKLTTAPELPATTLANYCYYKMFNGCTALNEIKCLATDISATNCTSSWVNGVAEAGTFIKNPDMTSWSTGTSGIPSGWTVINNGETPAPDPEEPENPEEPETTAYVTFTAQEDNSSIGLEKLSTKQTLEYSTDTTTWNTFDTTTNISLNNGDKVYVRGVLSADNSLSNYTQFKMTGKIAASGNCNALWNYQDLDAPLKDYCGCYMFRNCTSLVTAPELPVTTLAEHCYSDMFRNCTSLTTAPELPATTLANGCYGGMFNGCSSLVTAPELPATTLVNYCYGGMFWGCTNLTSAPELPATTLTKACYQSMFKNCISLTTAPELPATTLADYCYSGMFDGCTSLNYIKCLATDISATGCTETWVQRITETGTGTGTFVKDPSMTSWTVGIHGIPNGWGVVNAEIA